MVNIISNIMKWLGRQSEQKSEVDELYFTHSEPIYCYDCEDIQVESYFVDKKGNVHTRWQCQCGVFWYPE